MLKTLQTELFHHAAKLDAVPATREHAKKLLVLAERALTPFTVAIAGRMKTGKSTLLNALVRKEIAVTGTEEATATINIIQHGTGDITEKFLVRWNDGRPDEFLSRKELCHWTGKEKENIENYIQKTTCLRFYTEKAPAHYLIVDTPGTGSAEETGTHEKITQTFLNPNTINASIEECGQADAILYVVSHSVRQSDSDSLEKLAGSRIPGTDPFNSVCVVHKWDHLEEDSEGDAFDKANKKAAQLFSSPQFKNQVAAVIAVSAPLARAADEAPDAFFDDLLKIVKQYDIETLEEILILDTCWDEEENRKTIRESFPLPWASFRLLVIQLQKNNFSDVASARDFILQKSGMKRLNELVTEVFFGKAETIQLCNLCQRAIAQIEPAIKVLTKHAENTKILLACLSKNTPPRNRKWLENTLVSPKTCHEIIEEIAKFLAKLKTTRKERLLQISKFEIVSSLALLYTNLFRETIVRVSEKEAEFLKSFREGHIQPICKNPTIKRFELHELMKKFLTDSASRKITIAENQWHPAFLAKLKKEDPSSPLFSKRI